MLKLHRAGWYLSETAYDRIRELARAAAFLTASSGRKVPFNLQGRAGSVVVLDAAANWLYSAAMLGDGRHPERPDPRLASLFLRLYPEHPLAAELAKQGFEATRAPLDGHRTMNIGAVAAHRRGDWLACVGGLSPLAGKHEIYPWTQNNNYSLFAKRGGLLLLHPSYSTDDKELGFGLNSGFHWAYVPGATSCLCSDVELIPRANIVHACNSGVAGGTSLGRDGIWGLAQTTGPAALFRKSVFFFDDRITVVTGGIRRWRKGPREEFVHGLRHLPTDRPVITTLFQWPLDEARPKVVSGKELSGQVETSSESIRPQTWLVDRHGHGYYIHASKEASLHVVRRRQEFYLYYDHKLKDRKDNPIRWGKGTWSVAGASILKADLESVRNKYQPETGFFELAWLAHRRIDDPRAEPSVYTVLPMAGVEKTREFAGMAASQPPYRLLCASDSLHSLYNVSSKTFCYVVFDPEAAAWPKAGPLAGASAPCFAMIRATDDGVRQNPLAHLDWIRLHGNNLLVRLSPSLPAPRKGR